MMKPLLRIEAVSHRYANGNARPRQVLHNISLTVNAGETLCLMGPSGCGKSTLIQLLAGLIQPSEGGIICGDREVAGPGPDRAIVFEHDGLLPWLNCFENVYLAVEHVFGTDETKGELRARTNAALNRVGLRTMMHHFPAELSAGMRRRVSLARAMATEPKVLLLDDPFSALDPETRAHLQHDLQRLVSTTGTTLVMATHDLDEALIMADRIVLLSKEPAATVADILPLSFTRPRKRTTLATHENYRLHQHYILDFLHKMQTCNDAAGAPTTLTT
jgi:nitrate/nitrite transport system ATP-binding protein